MAKAKRVHSTPPTNTSATRRAFINTIAALPMAAAAPAAAEQTLDAELMELGAQFEPLVDHDYVAQRRWSGSLVRAQAEHDRGIRHARRAELSVPAGDRCGILG